MGYDWIKVSVKTPDHPKIQRLEKALGIDDGLGCVVRLWTWTADYYPDGDFPADAAGAMARKVAGDVATLRNVTPSRVTDALVTAGLLDPHGDRYEVHDWPEHEAAHADKAERDRELNRERQRRFRNRRRNGPVTRDRNVTDNVTRNDEALPRGEERRGDQKQQQRKPTDLAVGALVPDTHPAAKPATSEGAPPPRGAAAPLGEPRRLAVVDESPASGDAPPTFPLTAAFRRGLAEALARTAPHPVGGGIDVFKACEAALERVPPAEAVELCRRRVLDDVAQRRPQPKTLRFFVECVLGDELTRRSSSPPKRRKCIGADENGAPIFEGEDKCHSVT